MIPTGQCGLKRAVNGSVCLEHRDRREGQKKSGEGSWGRCWRVLTAWLRNLNRLSLTLVNW